MRLRIAATLAALVTAPLLLAACTDDDDAGAAPGSGGRLRVVATTAQVEALTREVAGGMVELTGLVPAGADAHDFEPVASDLVAVESADLVLRHGIDFDAWLDDIIGAGSATVVTVTEGITLHAGALGDHDNDDDHADDEHGDIDPHVWHDPDNVKIMVQNITRALGQADPANAATYEANATAYAAVLDETKAAIQAMIDEVPEQDRKLVTNHDAFGYFARAFGLEIVGAVIPSVTTGAEPSARETAALMDTIEREGVKAIFAESSVNSRLAESLARDAGITIVDDLYGDSLGPPGSGADTVHGMLLTNAEKIVEALR